MGLSGSGINEENHTVNGSWIALLIDDSIVAILPVPFCPYHFVPYHFDLEPNQAMGGVDLHDWNAGKYAIQIAYVARNCTGHSSAAHWIWLQSMPGSFSNMFMDQKQWIRRNFDDISLPPTC